MNNMFAAMLGGWEIVLILAIALLLFGAKRLPDLAKGLGTGIREFKKATREVTEEIQNAAQEPPPAPRKLPPSGAAAQTETPASSDTPQA